MVAARDVDARLRAAADAHARLRALDAELHDVDAELQKARSSEERWRRQATCAADELRGLRGFSLSALWHRWRGSAARRIAEQEARIAEARREQEAIDGRTEPVLRRRAELARCRLPLAGSHEELAAAVAAKDAFLRANGGALAERAASAAAALERLQREQRRIDGVLAAARQAEAALVQAREQLGQLRQSGQADRLRRGVVGSLAMHGELEVARGHLERAGRALEHVVEGLGDEAAAVLGTLPGGGPGIGGLLASGLVTDLWSPVHLGDAHECVREFLPRLRDAILGVERRSTAARAAVVAAADERAAWLCSVRLD